MHSCAAVDRSQSSEPTCDRPFNFDFERMDGPMSTELTKREVQELMFEEVSVRAPGCVKLTGGAL